MCLMLNDLICRATFTLELLLWHGALVSGLGPYLLSIYLGYIMNMEAAKTSFQDSF